MDTHEATGTIREMEGKAERQYGKARETLRERFGSSAEEAQESVQSAWEDTLDWIREYPAASVGMALLAGAGIGAALVAWLND